MVGQGRILSNIREFIEKPIPESVRDHGVLTVADILSATTAGAAVAPVDRIGQEAEFGKGPATVIGTARQVRPEQAALVNASAKKWIADSDESSSIEFYSFLG